MTLSVVPRSAGHRKTSLSGEFGPLSVNEILSRSGISTFIVDLMTTEGLHVLFHRSFSIKRLIPISCALRSVS